MTLDLYASPVEDEVEGEHAARFLGGCVLLVTVLLAIAGWILA